MTRDSAALDSPALDRRPTAGGRRHGLALMAVSALLMTTVAACGTDSGDDPTATDPTTSTTSSTPSTSASPTESATASGSATASDSPTDSGDPVPSPIINKAVKSAIQDDFPALVPAGVPAGWTVESAKYSPNKAGGTWQIRLTEPNGGQVTLLQAAQDLKPFLVANLAADMEKSGNVDLGEYGTGKWTVYTGTGSASTAIATYIARTSALVVGPDQDSVVELAEQLLTAEDSGNGSGDG